MKTDPTPALPEASTAPDKGLLGVVLPRLVLRFRVGLAWQWRRGVMAAEMRNLAYRCSDLLFTSINLMALVIGLLIWPAVIAWRFTGGMIWQCLTVEDEVIEKLAVKLRRDQSQNTDYATTG